MYGRWEVIKRKCLGGKRGNKVLDTACNEVRIRMTGQGKSNVLCEEIDVHKVGG